MATLEQLYAPSEVKTPLVPGEQVRYSLSLTQGKKGWLGYEVVHGVSYVAHLTSGRLILESHVLSSRGFFLQKALVIGLSLAAWRYRVPHATQAGGDVVDQMRHSEKEAAAVRDQTFSLPYDDIDRVETSFPAWLRVVLKNPPPTFDPHSLVYMPAPLAGRAKFRTGWATSTDAKELFSRVLRDCPREATVVS